MSIKSSISSKSSGSGVHNRKVGVLGPEWSHSHMALRSLCLDEFKISFLSSIKAGFSALRDEVVDVLFVPIENSFHGPVLETLDGLMSLHFEGTKFPVGNKTSPQIIHTYNYNVRHFIGVPGDANYELPDVEVVFSHEQALAQCSDMLQKIMPHTALEPVKSTSFALHIAKNESRPHAVIASQEALSAHAYRILQEATPQEGTNITRFALIGSPKLLTAELMGYLPTADSRKSSDLVRAAHICCHPRKDRQGLLLEILNIVSKEVGCNLLSIHSRPDTRGGFVFFLEVEDFADGALVAQCIESLTEFGSNKTQETFVVRLMGSYLREPFNPSLIKTIGIIGAEGAMGKWFSGFFQARGLNVIGVDQKSGTKVKSQLKQCEVIIFSVPLGSLKSAFHLIEQFLPDHCLLVDNSSVKGDTLSFLCDFADPNLEVLGIHTMFGPREEALDGNNIVVSRTHRSGAVSEAFESFLYKHGARLLTASPEKHDQLSAYTQSLVHLLTLTFGLSLKNSGVALTEFDAAETPNFRRMLENLDRVLSQSSELTARIQNDNPFSKLVQKEAQQSLTDLSKIFGTDEFILKLEELKPYFAKQQ